MSKQPQIWKQALGENADKNDILNENLEAGFVDQKFCSDLFLKYHYTLAVWLLREKILMDCLT